MKENKNEELQSRREFFKKAAKAALPVVGAVVLANLPLQQVEAMGCEPGCSHGCTGGCNLECKFTCYQGCYTGCRNTCSGTCSGGCARNAYA